MWTFLSKSLEKLAAKGIIEHIQLMMEPYQSAYNEDQSTETALLKVKTYVMKAIDKGKVVSLVLLDLSPAFNTVDHEILFHRLEYEYNINATASKWIHSYQTENREL